MLVFKRQSVAANLSTHCFDRIGAIDERDGVSWRLMSPTRVIVRTCGCGFGNATQ